MTFFSAVAAAQADEPGLWKVYNDAFKGAKYVDLTHTITPKIPVWAGFGNSTFAPAKAGANLEGFAKQGDVYTYDKHGFEATSYLLTTDQLGTQLDPPAHWAPEYSASDELPATFDDAVPRASRQRTVAKQARPRWRGQIFEANS
ncbi:hypothetical protein G9X64_31155 [Rhizobium sophorae]|uniref:Uncharacterized protein n=1 Tax=Rhizobium sophorae TaxID=1535242 RepID=A0A7Y3SBV5_9HYPH|nr:cyclase family protein [Rhizobium sophorae]NNU40864.1 hypothetical protein [Rhizobium sophorae]